MLIAKNVKGVVVNLLCCSKETLVQLKGQTYTCSTCSGGVILKSGEIRQAHFAHKSRRSCLAFSEGETAEHLEGKRLLVQWCQKYHVAYQLEAYLPKLKQRPDILIGDHWAIEFQCSGLSLARFKERTKNYQQHGYQVIWLVGAHFFIKRQLTETQRRFLYYHQNIGFYFWELAVSESAIRLHTFIEELTGSKKIISHKKSWRLEQKHPLEVLNYPETADLFVFRQYDWVTLVLKYLTQLEKRVHYKEKKSMKIQAELYQKKQYLAGLDIVHFSSIQQPLYSQSETLQWSLIFWESIAEMKTKEVGLSQIEVKLAEKIREQKIVVTELPCLSEEIYVRDFLKNYLPILEKLNYLKVVEENLVINQFPLFFEQPSIRQKYFLEKFNELSRFTATPLKSVIK